MMGFCLPALLAALATVEAPLNGGVIIKSQEAVDLTPLTAVTNAIPWAAEIAAKHPIKRIVDMVDDAVLYEQPSKMNPFNWGTANPTAVTLPDTDFTKVYRVELE